VWFQNKPGGANEEKKPVALRGRILSNTGPSARGITKRKRGVGERSFNQISRSIHPSKKSVGEPKLTRKTDRGLHTLERENGEISGKDGV